VEKIMRKHKYLILIVVLIGVMGVEASARRAILGPLVSDLLIALIALAVFLAVFKGRRERTVAFVAAAAALVFSLSRHLPIPAEYETARAVAHRILMALFLGFAVATILRNIFAEKAITGDEVLGAVCGYLLAAAMWANLYAATEILVPDSFSVSNDLKELATTHGRTALFNYFSVVTLTTMGYGDITPVRAPATALAMLEAIFGQFYIAVVVAQLVGLRLAQSFTSTRPPSRQA
jgi:hypothetical protein